MRIGLVEDVWAESFARFHERTVGADSSVASMAAPSAPTCVFLAAPTPSTICCSRRVRLLASGRTESTLGADLDDERNLGRDTLENCALTRRGETREVGGQILRAERPLA